jgi:hypothetical protein
VRILAEWRCPDPNPCSPHSGTQRTPDSDSETETESWQIILIRVLARSIHPLYLGLLAPRPVLPLWHAGSMRLV